MKDNSNQDYYNADSKSYDETRWTTKAGVFTNAVQQQIVVGLTADWDAQSVLEVGPGTARFTIPLAQKRNRITLVDISSGMLDVARRNLADEGLDSAIVASVEASLYELPLEPDQFDHAICLNVLSHLEKGATAIRQLARVVKPGGTLLINYPNLQSYYWPAAKRINDRSKAVGEEVYSIWERPARVLQWLSDAGLELLARRGHVHVPRALERYRLLPVIRGLDLISRRAPLSRIAPIHFCLCRKPG